MVARLLLLQFRRPGGHPRLEPGIGLAQAAVGQLDLDRLPVKLRFDAGGVRHPALEGGHVVDAVQDVFQLAVGAEYRHVHRIPVALLEPAAIGPEVAIAAFRHFGGRIGRHPLKLVGDAGVFAGFEDALIPTRARVGALSNIPDHETLAR